MNKVCSVGVGGYEADVEKLIRRRLDMAQSEIALNSDTHGGRISAHIDDDAKLREWCAALELLLMRDLVHFELADMVNALPLSLEDRQNILPEAVKLSRAIPVTGAVKHALEEYYRTSDHVNLEGFMRFRMKAENRALERCVARAHEELMLEKEYVELISVLSAFVRIQPSRIKNVYVILNPDGSCTLTDDMDSRVDYERCTGDGIISVLVGLSPERITVYDLSEGRNATLTDVLIKVFEDRIKYFK